MATTVAGFGIGSGAVRSVAEAAGAGDLERVARTAAALRRTTRVLGAVGAVVLALLSWPISSFTFKSSRHAWPLVILAVTVFTGLVSAGQTSLVQGMRRIGDLSRLNVVGGLLGTLAAVPLLICLGQTAILPLILACSLITMLASWWYARKLSLETLRLTWRETWAETRGMLQMGVAFLVTGILAALVAYVIRALVVRDLGMEAAGHYQAAFSLAGVYAGFVLQAMGADFFPRLTAMAHDNLQCNRLVNEQSEVSLLLVGPGVLFTLAFAPVVIHVFYAASFQPAVELLRWFAIGLLLRVISWPLGFILVAKGLACLFMWTELVSNMVYVALLFVGVHYVGLVGTALGFIGYYAFYLAMIATIAWRISGFRWSESNLRYGVSVIGVALGLLGLSFAIKETVVAVIGSGGALAFGFFSLRRLSVTLRGTRFEPYLARVAPSWLYSSSTM
jgi:PST family polysaccharide transporter